MAHGQNAAQKCCNREYGSKHQPDRWMCAGVFAKRETIRFRRRLSKQIVEDELEEYLFEE